MATNPIVNKWLDLADRVGWTGIAAAAGAVGTVLLTDGIGWEEALVFIGLTTLGTIVKVITGQHTGTDNSGSLIGQPVISPPPK